MARAVLAWDFRDPGQARLSAVVQRAAELVEGEQRQALEALTAIADMPVSEKCARVFSLLDAAAGAAPDGRIWLLWQNAENVLDAGRRFRDAELGAFARMLWEQEHRCCLIVESRLLPELPAVRKRLTVFGGASALERGWSRKPRSSGCGMSGISLKLRACGAPPMKICARWWGAYMACPWRWPL